MIYPKVKRVIHSHASSDGDGVKIRRVALFNETISDPFLMIDELRSDNPNDYIGGFPPHPHRGMETLTYLRQGALEHRDHLGNRGMINSGGAQWMSAGRGIIHSEMPSREADGLHGFQLWINLPAANKMQPPDYRDVPANEIPQYKSETGVITRAIAGAWLVGNRPVEGALMNMAAGAGIMDIEIPAGKSLSISAPSGHSLMAFVYDGALSLETAVATKSLIVFEDTGEPLGIHSESGAALLLLSGKPIREKIVHYGPFVMNTTAEIEQAIDDYNNGRF
jgi:quercetin 2,3-dioxygenase